MEQKVTIIMIPEETLASILSVQKDILNVLDELKSSKESGTSFPKYLTVKEFMSLARIGRTKFDELRHTNKIRFVKKKRKLYIPYAEIERYFSDPKIQ